jgi:hypothetical protein
MAPERLEKQDMAPFMFAIQVLGMARVWLEHSEQFCGIAYAQSMTG